MKEYQTKMEAMTSKMNQVEINSKAMEDRVKDLNNQLETLGKDYRFVSNYSVLLLPLVSYKGLI